MLDDNGAAYGIWSPINFILVKTKIYGIDGFTGYFRRNTEADKTPGSEIAVSTYPDIQGVVAAIITRAKTIETGIGIDCFGKDGRGRGGSGGRRFGSQCGFGGRGRLCSR